MVRMAAFVAALAISWSAAARPTYQVEHCVELGPVLPAFFCIEGVHAYGTSSQISGANGAWSMTSPAPGAPGFDRSVLCDFTGFNLYWRSTITLSGIDPPVTPGSGAMFAGGKQVGQVISGGETVQATFLTSDVMTPIPEPTIVIVWNDGGGCYPDCTGDGALTIADFGCFQGAFAAGATYADCNADGALTVADFGCFQAAFVTGCP